MSEEATYERRAKGLSDAAKCVAGAWFGMMVPGKGELTLRFEKSKPTKWAQDGLNELVREGFATVEPFNQYGGLIYRPMVDCRWALKWMARNGKHPLAKQPLNESIVSEADARAQQEAALSAATLETSNV